MTHPKYCEGVWLEGFLKQEGGVGPFCGRRYIVLGPGGAQEIAHKRGKVGLKMQHVHSGIRVFCGRRYIIFVAGDM